MQHVGLRVHYRDMTCIKYRQDIFMSWDTLLAAFGGIFGLCLGGSVISLIEFIYCFTFKLFHIYDSRKAVDGNLNNNNSSRFASRELREKRNLGGRARLNYTRNGVNLGVGQRTMQFNVANKLFANYPRKYGNFLNWNIVIMNILLRCFFCIINGK